jgi:Na+-driven multidrug efflux pump
MTTHSLRRWGAVLLAGGLCMAVAYSFFPSDAHSARIRPAAALALVGVLLALPGLVGFQRGQSARARVNGWVGTGLTVLAIALLEIPHLVLGTFSPSSLYDLDAYHSGMWGTLEFSGLALLPVGLIVLAVAVWRSGTYPRWAFWLLVANIAVGAVDSVVPPLADALRQPALNYVLMGLLGLAMIRLAKDRDAVAPSVGRRDPATTASL